MLKRAIILVALAATIALPFVLRPKQRPPERADDTLVIITPHNEAIRHEFAAGFRAWYRARTGRTVTLDWRVIGGTSEIARFLESEYIASFKRWWSGREGRPWSAAVQSGFSRASLPADAPAAVVAARDAFFASDVGCGIDVFFGGGPYDFMQQAAAGRLVPSRVMRDHPDWFAGAVIPHREAGEDYWDKDGRWVGNVLSNYGILYNRDSLARLGLSHPPHAWADLADFRYVGEVALADPTKSGSVAAAFENIVQQQIQIRLRTLQAADPAAAARDPRGVEARAVREGWLEGLRLLQRIGANARYFTDSSQKPPIDVAQGNCAAGIAIDFYGRSQAGITVQRSGESRLQFVTPVGGTVSSVDPIGLLRGAPHRDVAEAFIAYTLSMDGQKLWGFRPGTPGGPERYALRRLPVRRDFYAQTEWKAWRSDPEVNPYQETDGLVYHPEWTGKLFRELAFIVRVMCIDTHPELVRAWRAIQAAPEPRRSAALAAMQDVAPVVDYERAGGEITQALTSKNKVDEVAFASELGAYFRKHYARAERLAQP